MNDQHFNKIYWFCVGICLYGAGLSILVIYISPKEIPVILTFWLSSTVAGAVGYLIGSSTQNKKPDNNNRTTAEVTATITQEPNEQQ